MRKLLILIISLGVFLSIQAQVINDCNGTIYDSGGPGGSYSNNEDTTYTICPSDPFDCLILEFSDLALEPQRDFIRIYEGIDVTGTLLANTSSLDLSNSFRVLTSSSCVTIQFTSDGSITNQGFALSWSCQNNNCEKNDISNAISISQLPFEQRGFNSCDNYSTIGGLSCNGFENFNFLGGPDYSYLYNPVSDQCIDLEVHSTISGTGIAVFEIDETNGNITCMGVGPEGFLPSIELEAGLDYIFVVANESGCFQFDFTVTEANRCLSEPSLRNALCNPLNACFDTTKQDMPERFVFEESSADVQITEGINSGCWALDFEPGSPNDDRANFYWFSLKAFQDGKIGFFVESVAESDIDFNVWGPFNDEDVCDRPDSLINLIENTQPIRSSFAIDDNMTGLADIHPQSGVPVFDDYDCDFPLTGFEGDGFTRMIDAVAGEVYIFLFNDFTGDVDQRGILVDWSPMDINTVLGQDFGSIETIDTTICSDDTLFLDFLSSDYNIRTIPSTNVSCQECKAPYIIPSDSISRYQLIASGACAVDTMDLNLNILDVEIPDSIFLCFRDSIVLDVEVDNQSAQYRWTGDLDGLSCVNCPKPVFNASNPGTYKVFIDISLSNCDAVDSVTILVDQFAKAPNDIIGDTTICQGEELSLNNFENPDLEYLWFENGLLFSTDVNPLVSPIQTTTYTLVTQRIDGRGCPYPTIDSVLVMVENPPVINLIDDITVCEGDTIQLNQTTIDPNATYEWSSNNGVDVVNPQDGIGLLVPIQSGIYTLEARSQNCFVEDQVEIIVIPNSISIEPSADTAFYCLEDTFQFSYRLSPPSAESFWIEGRTDDTIRSNSFLGLAEESFWLYAYTDNMGCRDEDSVFVRVDSLPEDLSISPQDTSVCEGSLVLLESPVFEPSIYEMTYQWFPTTGGQTGDSLYNYVINAIETTTYSRISRTGACIDTATTTVFVNKIPIVSINPSDTTICPGETVQLIATVDPPTASLMWSGGLGLSCMDCRDPFATVSESSQFTLEVDNNGCPGSASATINVESSAPPFSAPLDLTICEGDPIALNPNENPNYSYEWDSEDPTFDQQNVRNPIVQPGLGSTRYDVTVTGDSTFCQSASYSLTVLVPKLDSLIDVVYCDDTDNFVFAATLINDDRVIPEGLLTWNTGDVNSIINIRPIDLAGDEVMVELNWDGCISEASASLIRLNDPSVQLTGSVNDDEAVFTGTNVSFSVDYLLDDRDDIDSIIWSINGNIQSVNQEDFTYTANQPGSDSVAVEVITINGCKISEDVVFQIVEVQIPNAFSPNGDGRNDFFNILPMELLETANISEFKVYSRWGTLIYNNEEPRAGWDGTDGENDLPVDTYKYIITIDRGSQPLTLQGEINLIR